ncbi:MAG: hypothetical protein IPJ49_30505 [Candidatus Obscuribacter sp.]|nr:hypothetical protein [Candidatus Obscuribacter sp.]
MLFQNQNLKTIGQKSSWILPSPFDIVSAYARVIAMGVLRQTKAVS